MEPKEVIGILQDGDFKAILVKQIANGSSSGRVFVPKKYLDMDAVIIIRDAKECPRCEGTGKRKKSQG